MDVKGKNGDLFYSTQEKLRVFKIQRTCVHDGPGIRTTVFFKGCGLNCLWCQNPEGLSANGKEAPDCGYSVDDIVEIVKRDKKYYFSTGGGVTLSGGEPFLQQKDALVELLKRLKEEGVSVAVETSLFAPWETVESAIPYVDLFFVDLKAGGQTELHKTLTGQNPALIVENLDKLLAFKVKIKMRTVVVPGYNDGEENLRHLAEFLSRRGIQEIELLKYHSFYEDKIKKFGFDRKLLSIPEEQSVFALKEAEKTMVSLGFSVYSADLCKEPARAAFTDRVLRVQKAIREAPRAVCMEGARLKTEYYRKNGFQKPVSIHRAERLRYVLQNKTIKLYPDELIVGNFTSKRVGAQIWEEHYGILIAMFLYKIEKQKPVAFQSSRRDKVYFYTRVFPFWLKHSLLRKAHPKLSDFIKTIARSSEMVAGFNNNLAAIAHFIVNFERILKLGTSGIIKEIETAMRERPENDQDFYRGAILSLQALEHFAARYADMLFEEAKAEKDAVRAEEITKIAEICRNVPRYPAKTFREALQSMAFLQIALCQESYENAVSFGRVDQFLYPYYRRDVEAGILTYEEAKELLCLFILKMDEAILVNDGDSYLNVGKLFETLSTDQALTFGGVDKNGNDATNDLTYMLVDACELQPLAVNMTARIHKNSPEKYLRRLAEIYINGCPMPELFSDEIYIESLMRHYPATIEHARNYSIVGCVEPNASDDHFGNTDCANMNLALPFMQALKGQSHDLWNYSKAEQREKIMTKFIRYMYKEKADSKCPFYQNYQRHLKKVYKKRGLYLYHPPKDMDELLSRFQQRLNALAASILKDHQNIEDKLRAGFTTPLASSLFENCIKTGKDVYDGGAFFNSNGIQAVGVTDVADSLFAVDEVVFKKKLYTLDEIILATEDNFKSEKNKEIQKALLAVPKYGDDSSEKASRWVTEVMRIYNEALASVPDCPRNGTYRAGYYALNVSDRYGKNTGALPSGRLAGVPLANSVIPHYGMEQTDLLSSLNAVAKVNFTDYAPNGTTVTFTIDSALFPGESGTRNLASVFKTFLTEGGMQFQPNVINKKILIEAYHHPEQYKYLMVRVAGYCAYFNELSDDLKKIIINRTCYS